MQLQQLILALLHMLYNLIDRSVGRRIWRSSIVVLFTSLHTVNKYFIEMDVFSSRIIILGLLKRDSVRHY